MLVHQKLVLNTLMSLPVCRTIDLLILINSESDSLIRKQSGNGTMVEHSATDPETKGSNPDTAQHQEKMAEKKKLLY